MKTRSQKITWGLMTFLAVAIFGYATAFYLVIPFFSSSPIGWQIHPALQRTLSTHPVGTYFHIIPSMLAILIGPFQFHRGIRTKHLKLHRWLGRIYLSGVLFGGLGGLYMAPFSFAGSASQLGFGLLAAAWLFTGYMAYLDIRQGRVETHREWMTRNYALTFAAVTLRIYTRTFFLMGMTLPDFHAVNAWLCWIPNLIFAEWLIHRTRARRGRPKEVTPVVTTAEGNPSQS
ncbi:MAG: DUF2306 domain-containing protein [Anaerolineae bacterium]|nr:DUF2306 domain-containing protein [Anaerolineae bacterium]